VAGSLPDPPQPASVNAADAIAARTIERRPA
jgi:hypothetical protein